MSEEEALADQRLNRVDCHLPFVWTVSEQRFFESVGHTHVPRCCVACRRLRRERSEATLHPTRPLTLRYD
jgi:predicted glycosyl hydrolase (DUF1957 family)